MIAAWMLWSIGAGLLLLVAGLAAEKLFEGRRRWVWVAAGVGTVLLTAARLFTSGGPDPEDGSGGPAIPEVTVPETNVAGAWEVAEAAPGTLANTSSPASFSVTIPHDSVLHSLDGALLPAWLALSAGLGLWALIGARGLRRRRRSWEPGTLLGQPVLWSRNTGPAIVGLRRPRVVLPSWVREVEASQQKLILIHEGEHRRTGDGIIRFAMAALTIAFPWNPFLWLHYRRLRLAIELDCDHRVVRRLPDRRWLYGDLLVRVGARHGFRPGFAPTAFAERRSFLERRIGKLLSEAPEVSMARMAFFAFAAVLVAGVALWAPGVTEEEARPDVPVPGFEFDVEAPVGLEWTSVEETMSLQLSADEAVFEAPLMEETMSLQLSADEAVFEAPLMESLQAPLPVLSLPVAPSPYLASYEVPPVPPDARVMERPQHVYHTMGPRLANRWHVKQALELGYPADLRDAGIGGATVLYLFVNTDGTVSEAIVKTSAGRQSLDRAAVRAAKAARFLPANNEGIPVGIWIEMEIPFTP